MASAPLRILLGYREMTEAAFLRNGAGQCPNRSGPGTGARREGGGTCTRCTCGWPGSRCARSWPALQENRGESGRSAALPTHGTDPTHLPVRKSVMPSLGLSWGALRLLMADAGTERPRELRAAIAGRRFRQRRHSASGLGTRARERRGCPRRCRGCRRRSAGGRYAAKHQSAVSRAFLTS